MEGQDSVTSYRARWREACESSPVTNFLCRGSTEYGVLQASSIRLLCEIMLLDLLLLQAQPVTETWIGDLAGCVFLLVVGLKEYDLD